MIDTIIEQFDAIIIGAGQAGGPLATALATSGRNTALIERKHVGGTCINEGCTPTKTMVASARVAYLARRSSDYGVLAGQVTVDMAQVRARKRAIVENFRTGSQSALEHVPDLELTMATAAFQGINTIEVTLTNGGTRILQAPTIVINTGERPAKPAICGLDTVQSLDSTSIMELDSVPPHLVILGGGYVAVEFGQMFRRFGSEVTIVQRGQQLLGREDKDIAAAVADILRADGIEIRVGADVRRVEGTGGSIQLHLATNEGEQTVTGSHLLVATGRTPNTDDLNLDAAGIITNARGYVQVNEHLETNMPGIYAVGDVNGGPAFTHISYDDFRILRDALIDGSYRTTSDRLTPYTVFLDPQLGRVGLTETEARAQGYDVRIATMPMSQVARASEVDETRGLMKAVVDGATDQILGCAILGMEGGEMMAMIEIAMMGRLPYTALRDGIFAHPTLAESFNNLFGTLEPVG